MTRIHLIWQKLIAWLDLWPNRGVAAGARVTMHVRWPLFVIPVLLINQLLAPHRVWTALLVTILGLYAIGLLWARSQAGSIRLSRQREGQVMLAGDALVEQFEIENESPLPLLWAELTDGSEMPRYNASRVVACAGGSRYRWQNKSICPRRGSYQLGPARLAWTDPFGIFGVTQEMPDSETVLIYPRVPHLPELPLPFGSSSGARQRRRPFAATLRSASIRAYQSGDSLRYIHWPATARHTGTTMHNGLMVTEREMEPGGEVWIVINTQRAAHTESTPESGTGSKIESRSEVQDDNGTFEYAIMVAAGLASQLLGSNERQSVGLLTVSEAADGTLEPILIAPQPGQAQFWRIMAKLAALTMSDLALDTLLLGNREVLRRGQTIVLITPASEGAAEWIAEIAHSHSQAASTVYLIEAADAVPTVEDQPAFVTPEQVEGVQSLLTSYDIPVRRLKAGTPLTAALTYRRTRRVIRSTPAGGAVALEVEEEVG